MVRRQFVFVRTRRVQLTRERAAQFYQEHRGECVTRTRPSFIVQRLDKFFYSRLVHYMSW
jgi:nucleoside diphosphate kinase